MKIRELKITTKEIKDRDISKISIKLDRPESDYIIDTLQKGNNRPVIVKVNEPIEFISNKNSGPLKIISSLDVEKIKLEFGIDIKLNPKYVVEPASSLGIHHVVDVSEPPLQVSTHAQIPNRRYIGSLFLSKSESDKLTCFFFLDIDGLIRGNSLFAKISNNILDTSELCTGIKILQFNIVRKRVIRDTPIEPGEVVNQIVEEIGSIINNGSKLYQFVDNVSSLIGSYQYSIEIIYQDPVTDYLISTLDTINSMIIALGTDVPVDIDIFLKNFKEYERLYYGFNTELEVRDTEDYNLFLERLRTLYSHLYLYVHSISYQNSNITICKEFEETYNVTAHNSGIRITELKNMSEFLTWSGQKTVIYANEKYDPESPELTAAMNLGKINSSLISKNRDQNVGDSFAYDNNVSSDGKFLDLLKTILYIKRTPAYIEILRSFDFGVAGENWSNLSKSIDKSKVFGRFVDNDFDLPIYNQYFVIKN